MQSALFTFKVHVKYKDSNGKTQEAVNINYINPTHVISAFWETRESGARLLNVFTNGASQDKEGNFHPGRTFTFPERDGERFIQHVEEFHCLLLGAGREVVQPTPSPYRNERPNRERSNGRRPLNIISEEIIEESETQGELQVAFEEN